MCNPPLLGWMDWRFAGVEAGMFDTPHGKFLRWRWVSVDARQPSFTKRAKARHCQSSGILARLSH